MRKLFVAAVFIGAAGLSFGQGYVSFQNTTSSRIATNGAVATGNPGGPVRSWYYELLVAPTSQSTIDATLSGWTPIPSPFGGPTGTNTASAGRVQGFGTLDTSSVQVPSFAAGTWANFAVVGWSANLGTDFNAVMAGRPSTLVSGVGNYGSASWSDASEGPGGPGTGSAVVPAGAVPGGAWYGISSVAAHVSLMPPGGPYDPVFGSATSGLIQGFQLNYYTASPPCTNPPVIASPPADQIALIGQNATLAVVAGCATGYQWQMDGTNLSGATGSQYVVTNAQLANAGDYVVIVTNSWGSVTSTPAILQVGQPIQGVYNTGVYTNGSSLQGGSVDPHWTLSGTVTGAPVVLSATNQYGQWTPDSTNSSWIGVYDSQSESTADLL